MYQGVIMSGFGGQGIVSAGILLAYAGMVDGKYVTTTPTADPIVLSPGRHHLLFTHSTFGSRTMEIELKAGEERVIVVKMGS